MNTALKGEPIELIRRPAVKALTRIGTTNIYEVARAGAFPRQVKQGGRGVEWGKAEVMAWNRAQVAAARPTHTSSPAADRGEESQKLACGVHINDFADYLDAQHRFAKIEHERRVGCRWDADVCTTSSVQKLALSWHSRAKSAHIGIKKHLRYSLSG
ncbi:helix-turn-helix transcriptional regulator [Pseudomonas sp. Pseusp122]|uniref:helix-turn-helix transcriptional regulator n=1 Tax=unclassified Pseudomonas TaxID=196821 RepID=UPI0039A5ADDC